MGPNNTWMPFNSSANFTLDTVDANLTIALGTNGNLWRLSPTGFSPYFMPPVPFPPGSDIHTFQGLVGLGKVNTSSAWFTGFSDNGTGLNKCINYSNHDFVTPPKIFNSPSLSKVFVLGVANKPAWMNSTGTIIRADLYVIECPNFQNISIPLDHLQDPVNVRINLGEDFIHIVKVDGSGVPTGDVVYYFK